MNNRLFENVLTLANTLADLPRSRFRHLSFLMDGSAIVSVGYNISRKTHPLAYRYGHRYASVHSELTAIKRYRGWPSDLCHFTLINVRLGASGPLMAKPCIACQKMLVDFGIRKVYYTNRSGGFDRL